MIFIDFKKQFTWLSVITLIHPSYFLGSPGRILDLSSNKQIADLSKCEIIVLDEADKLLSVDF